MVAVGAGLLWLGWNGFNGGDPYFAGASASAAVVNTNLCTAVAMLAWIGWDLIYKDKPSLIGTVNGMITGLVGDHAGRGLCQRLRRDHHRRRRDDRRLDVDPLPQPHVAVPRSSTTRSG